MSSFTSSVERSRQQRRRPLLLPLLLLAIASSCALAHHGTTAGAAADPMCVLDRLVRTRGGVGNGMSSGGGGGPSFFPFPPASTVTPVQPPKSSAPASGSRDGTASGGQWGSQHFDERYVR